MAAFDRPAKSNTPAAYAAGGGRALVQDRHEAEGVQPSDSTDKETFQRYGRVSEPNKVSP